MSLPHSQEPGWQQLSSTLLCSTPHVQLRQTVLASPMRPAGRPWTIAHRKPAAVIAPLLRDGRFALIRQERPPTRRTHFEFPAGQVDELATPDAIEATARRELLEETGLICTSPLKRLGAFYSSPGFTDEFQTIFLASPCQPANGQNNLPSPEHDEAILEIVFWTPAQLATAVSSGQICDANTLCAFALLAAAGLIQP